MNAQLTEPGVRAYFITSLTDCKEMKMKYYTTLLNSGLFVLFCVLLGGILWYKYKGKLTPKQKKSKLEADRIYILNRLKLVDQKRQLDNNVLITGLPF
jgi:hypothetical protein